MIPVVKPEVVASRGWNVEDQQMLLQDVYKKIFLPLRANPSISSFVKHLSISKPLLTLSFAVPPFWTISPRPND
jgi:hypothetical protein